jgi:dipeptidyl aminopeptidase/acylaminoacyl peptidase
VDHPDSALKANPVQTQTQSFAHADVELTMRCLLLLIAVMSMACAQGARAPMSTEVMMGLKSVIQAVVSPDGTKVAVVTLAPRDLTAGDGTAFRRLSVVPASGGAAQELVGGECGVLAPVWSADGTSVAVLGRLAGSKAVRVYRCGLDGSAPQAISPEGITPSAFAISPDGKTLALVATPAASAAESALVAAGYNQLVYEESLKNADVLFVDIATGTTRRAELPGCAYEIAFGDAGTVWCTAARTPTTDDSYMEKDLWRVNVADGTAALACNVPGKFGVFAVSANGERVAFTAGVDRHDPSNSGLFHITRAGGEASQITPADFAGEVGALTWRDDDTLLAATSFGLDRAVLAINVKGGAWSTALACGALQGTTISASANGRTLVQVSSSAVHPGEAFVQDFGADGAASGSPRRLTTTNPQLDGVEFGAQEAFEWKARDGLSIQGVLIKPTGFTDGVRYPLIVVVHGGPESHYSNAWLTRYADPGQVGAAQGYVCFYPNYRGSTGRGSAFSRMDQSDNGGKEFDDVLDGIDALVARGIVDGARVGITGGSYGGYFTAWGATKHTKRFKAGVMFVGISNNLSKMGTTDIPNEMLDVHWLKSPWEHRDLYLDRSPITYARDSETPLLILHGKDDPRVSPTQSLELYRWMKVKGTNPVRLVLYPGEGHGNTRRSSQYDYALRMMEWFNTWLLESGSHRMPPLNPAYPVLPSAPAPAAK